jgi:hypothetical protein
VVEGQCRLCDRCENINAYMDALSTDLLLMIKLRPLIPLTIQDVKLGYSIFPSYESGDCLQEMSLAL